MNVRCQLIRTCPVDRWKDGRFESLRSIRHAQSMHGSRLLIQTVLEWMDAVLNHRVRSSVGNGRRIVQIGWSGLGSNLFKSKLTYDLIALSCLQLDQIHAQRWMTPKRPPHAFGHSHGERWK